MRNPTVTLMLRPGAPCPCRPNRYIRFIIPRGVPGCAPIISCRQADLATRESIKEHEIPAGAEVEIWVGGLS